MIRLPPDPWVFAVEPDAIQITWRARDGRPAGAELRTGLDPGPLAPPAGPELVRIATINDLHIGNDRFDVFGRMHEPPAEVPHAVRCLRDALAQALAWGAQFIIVKGDLTNAAKEEEFEVVGTELARVPVPIAIVPGNHEVKPGRTLDPQPALAGHGLHLVHGVEVVDLPGVRLILGDTTIPEKDAGRIAHLAPTIVRAARRAPAGVLVAVHHHPQRFAFPTFLPVGIPGPESRAFLDELAAANPHTLMTTGHTHRHRRHRHGPLTITEVGSTKDFPGTWTGYVVHEGGIRQVVRRIADPSCLPWLDETAHATFGLWGRWSPGTLDDRCFSVTWS